MIEWTAGLSVGNEILDNDRKVLVRCLNDYIFAVEQDKGTFVIDSIFRELISYTNYHFSREERALAACGYPHLEEHKAEHAAIKEQLTDHCYRYLNSPDKTLDDEVQKFLCTWLGHHICEEDFAYRNTLAENKDAVNTVLREPQVVREGL